MKVCQKVLKIYFMIINKNVYNEIRISIDINPNSLI